jgi:type II secretory pathway pseudopilin PulG
VELLVVIAIIGILVALLLPAIQAAREAARRAECTNHLKQIGTAFLMHENAHKILPGAGTSCYHVGDAMRGRGKKQTGGWMFNILPYIEEQEIYNLTNDGDAKVTTAQKAAAKRMQETPVTVYSCPTRRPPRAVSWNLDPGLWQPANSDLMQVIVRGDYAANGGDGECGKDFPIRDSSGKITDCNRIPPPKAYSFLDNPQLYTFPSEKDQSGINFLGAEISFKDITDGTSHVYMVGEKYVDANKYEGEDLDFGDNHSAYQGYDWDINRWATETWPATRDRPGFDAFQGFGSAHASGWQAVLCDGSVHIFPYDMENLVHVRLANRFDGETIPALP